MNLLGFQNPYGAEYTSLLGVDPNEMRRKALWAGLAQAGFKLMGSTNMGDVGSAFSQGVNSARDDYMQQALLGYKLKTEADDRAFNRQWQQDNRTYNRERDKRNDAWTNTNNQHTLETWQAEDEKRRREDELRQGKQNAVTGWMQNYAQQGGTLPFSPEVRGLARQGGLGGVSGTDEWRYGQMQPYAQAGDYETAFGNMTAAPPAPDYMAVGKDSRVFDKTQGAFVDGPAGSAPEPDWQQVVLDDGVYMVDKNNPENRKRIGERPNRNEGEGRDFTQEGKLRTEYYTQAKPFADLRTNYQRMKAAANDNNGASDIAMVYSFMKMLDPTSVVREGEFATAEQAGGVPTQIVQMYNRAVTGERLPPEIRQQFLQQATRQFQQQQQSYSQIREQYRQLAQQYGVDPARVAPDLSYGVDIDPSTVAVDGIPQEAVQELLNDPSPQAAQEFDQTFGAGSAAKVLGRR